MLSLSHVWLWDPMACSPPGSSVPRILQAGKLEWVAMASSRGSSRPREPASLMSPALTGGFFTTSANGEVLLFINTGSKSSVSLILPQCKQTTQPLSSIWTEVTHRLCLRSFWLSYIYIYKETWLKVHVLSFENSKFLDSNSHENKNWTV